MSDPLFQSLSAKERLGSLRFASDGSGVQANLLEKDIWVVQVLATLFNSPFGGDLTFKGGTSLSKVYRAIRRFSEDIDITYDIRALAPSLAAQDDIDSLPSVLYLKYVGKSGPRWPGFGQRSWSRQRAWGLRW